MKRMTARQISNPRASKSGDLASCHRLSSCSKLSRSTVGQASKLGLLASSLQWNSRLEPSIMAMPSQIAKVVPQISRSDKKKHQRQSLALTGRLTKFRRHRICPPAIGCLRRGDFSAHGWLSPKISFSWQRIPAISGSGLMKLSNGPHMPFSLLTSPNLGKIKASTRSGLCSFSISAVAR